VTYASTRGQAGHPQFEGRSLSDERRLIPGFTRVPLVTGHLAQPQMQRPDLGHSLGCDLFHQAEHRLALVEVVDRYQDPREHRTSRGLHLIRWATGVNSII